MFTFGKQSIAGVVQKWFQSHSVIGAPGDGSPNDHLDTIAPTVQPTIEGLGSSGSRDMPGATECKYYRIRDGIIFDMQGNQQSQKWAKRMRQKERDEKADDSSRSSSSGMADSKAMKWLQGGGEAEGAMAIAAPEAKPKSAEGEVQGAMAIAAPEPKPKASLYVPKTGCNKAKPLTNKPHAGKRIETWPPGSMRHKQLRHREAMEPDV